MKNSYTVIIAGSGGQGIKMLALIMARIFMQLGLKVAYLVDYDSASRGGEVRAFVSAGREKVNNPVIDEADLMIVLYRRRPEMKAKIVLADTKFAPAERGEKLAFTESAISQFTKPIYAGMIALGGALHRLDISLEEINLREAIPDKLPNENIAAVKYGYQL